MSVELIETPATAATLTEASVDRLLDGALQVLEDVGFVYAYQPALDAVERAGCVVDRGRQRARLPRTLVEESLRQAPDTVVHKGRTRDDDVRLDAGHVAFTVSGGGSLLDRRTGRQRPALVGDIQELVTFIDHVEGIDLLNSPLAVADCPRHLTAEFILAEVLKYARKPIVGCGPLGVGVDRRVQLRLAEAAGREVMNTIGPVSPLSLPTGMCEALMLWAERGWPCLCWSGPTPGANGPASLAGTLVVALAEIMAAIVLAQTVAPRSPVVAGYSAMLMDMRSGSAYTGVEGLLLCNAAVQVLHRFGIPFWSACPMVTGNVAGWQNGMQVGMQVPLLVQGGGDIVSFSGGLSMDCAYSYAQLLLDDELISATKRYAHGVRIDDRSLALDVIRSVGSAPADYLGNRHTRDEHSREVRPPDLLTTAPYRVWETHGSADAVDRATERAKAMWESEITADPLPPDVCRDLDSIVRQAVEGP